MYWIVWAGQMEKEAIGRLQKQQPGILGLSCHLLTIEFVEYVILTVDMSLQIPFCSHEGEMYKSLLSDYEASQRALMLENAELKKVLQQMKKEIMHILSSRQSSTMGATANESQEQVLFIILCEKLKIGGPFRSGPGFLSRFIIWPVITRKPHFSACYEIKSLHVEHLLCFRLIQMGRRRRVTLAGKHWTNPVSTLRNSLPIASASSGENWGTTWRS